MPAEWLWRQPAVTILSTTLPRPTEHKNALRASATASLSIRIPPGATAKELRAELEKLLLVDPPAGVKVTFAERPGGAESWLYEPQGAAFEAADRAYEKAWGRPLAQIGIGGSIPFVALFGRRYAHLPLILNGVMDPETGAHGPNESLHLGVFEKAIAANIYLYEELGQLTY
jgi:acetylornithine deacetylase/succinyl-diaminopimelate desuccinylase-like protein